MLFKVGPKGEKKPEGSGERVPVRGSSPVRGQGLGPHLLGSRDRVAEGVSEVGSRPSWAPCPGLIRGHVPFHPTGEPSRVQGRRLAGLLCVLKDTVAPVRGG